MEEIKLQDDRCKLLTASVPKACLMDDFHSAYLALWEHTMLKITELLIQPVQIWHCSVLTLMRMLLWLLVCESIFC